MLGMYLVQNNAKSRVCAYVQLQVLYSPTTVLVQYCRLLVLYELRELRVRTECTYSTVLSTVQ